MSDTVNIPEPEQQLFNWYFSGTVLDCLGAATVIKRMNPITHEVELSFRDGSAVLSFDYALGCLKEATAETGIGNER